MPAARPQPPRLPEEPETAWLALPVEEHHVREVRVEDVEAGGLQDVDLTDVVIERCDLANADLREVRWSRVELNGCRMTGVNFTSAKLADVRMRDCRVDLATFGSGSLTRVTFEDCVLQSTDFHDAGLEHVRWHGCDLRMADLRGARVKSSELRAGRLDGLHGIDRLRGVQMAYADILENAVLWAAALGIEVIE